MSINNHRRRDWFQILRHLMSAGISMSFVGRKCQRDVGTVRAWAEGGEPKESDARIVLALYAKHCPVQYRTHQARFEIHVEIEGMLELGENRALPFALEQT